MRLVLGWLWLGLACSGEVVTADDDDDDDDDGFVASEDCDDNNDAIRPDAVDLGGDGIDANCDGVYGSGTVRLDRLHAGVTGIGRNRQWGGFGTTVCELTGDGVTDVLFGVLHAHPSSLRVVSSPMQSGSIPDVTASIIFSIEQEWMVSPHCADWNGDGRDDVMALLTTGYARRFVVWEQPEGGFSGRMNDEDAVIYDVPGSYHGAILYGEIDDQVGVDVVFNGYPDGVFFRRGLLSGGSPSAGVETLMRPFGWQSDAAVNSFARIQLDGDADLETVVCIAGMGCFMLDGYRFDQTDTADTMMGGLESTQGWGNDTVVVGDFDGDGVKDDLIGYSSERGLDVYVTLAEQLRADGVATPDHHIRLLAGDVQNIGDLDADGVDDIAIHPSARADFQSNVYSVAVMVDEGLDRARLLQIDLSPKPTATAHGGDFDGDGRPDLVLSAYDFEGTGQLGVYLSSQAP